MSWFSFSLHDRPSCFYGLLLISWRSQHCWKRGVTPASVCRILHPAASGLWHAWWCTAELEVDMMRTAANSVCCIRYELSVFIIVTLCVCGSVSWRSNTRSARLCLSFRRSPVSYRYWSTGIFVIMSCCMFWFLASGCGVCKIDLWIAVIFEQNHIRVVQQCILFVHSFVICFDLSLIHFNFGVIIFAIVTSRKTSFSADTVCWVTSPVVMIQKVTL